jgi:four helix bundle protein
MPAAYIQICPPLAMSDRVEDFDDLRVYRTSFKHSMEIFELSGEWPKEERYALTDQIRRSSRAVCSNIAEAWSKRRYEAHFISKLSDAEGEAAETITWLDFAQACDYLPEDNHEQLRMEYRKIRGGADQNDEEPRPVVRPFCFSRIHLGLHFRRER